MNQHYPAPWWYRLANVVFPSRCREIPESTDPDRILLRQFAIIRRYVYLQQFASSEAEDWFHAHNWFIIVAIGLWGGYKEEIMPPGHTPIEKFERRAPYLTFMDRTIRHRVSCPSTGHTSLSIGLGPNYGDRTYFHRNDPSTPVSWQNHVKKLVRRI